MYEVKFSPNVKWEVTSLCSHKRVHCYNYWLTDAGKVFYAVVFNGDVKACSRDITS